MALNIKIKYAWTWFYYQTIKLREGTDPVLCCLILLALVPFPLSFSCFFKPPPSPTPSRTTPSYIIGCVVVNDKPVAPPVTSFPTSALSQICFNTVFFRNVLFCLFFLFFLSHFQGRQGCYSFPCYNLFTTFSEDPLFQFVSFLFCSFKRNVSFTSSGSDIKCEDKMLICCQQFYVDEVKSERLKNVFVTQ